MFLSRSHPTSCLTTTCLRVHLPHRVPQQPVILFRPQLHVVLRKRVYFCDLGTYYTRIISVKEQETTKSHWFSGCNMMLGVKHEKRLRRHSMLEVNEKTNIGGTWCWRWTKKQVEAKHDVGGERANTAGLAGLADYGKMSCCIRFAWQDMSFCLFKKTVAWSDTQTPKCRHSTVFFNRQNVMLHQICLARHVILPIQKNSCVVGHPNPKVQTLDCFFQ